MSKNELMTMKEGTFQYEFKPAEIEINDYEGLLERAELVAAHYGNLVLTNSSLKEINETHRELNSFVKGLEEGRLNVKREYNKPLNKFETKIKNVVGVLNKPLQDIKDARDEILIMQEETRKKALIDYLEMKLKDSKVRIDDLEIKDSWTNKGNWTEKLNPRKPLKEEIKKDIGFIEEEYRKKIANREVLEAFLDEKGLEHEGWLSQLDHRDSLSIIQEIQRTEKIKKQRAQEEEERNERRLKQQEEVKKQNELREQQKSEDEEITRSEPETNSGIGASFQKAKEPEPQLIRERIQVTGTLDQLNGLKRYLHENGIKVEPIIDAENETKDDLPF